MNGLSSMNGLMTTSAGRKTVSYLVKCALGSNDSLVKADQNGTNYTFAGGIGLCPALEERRRAYQRGPVHGGRLRLHAGARQHRRRPRPALARLERHRHRLGHRPDQLPDAGGDVLRRHHRHRRALARLSKPSITAPVAYYCDGAGFPTGASGVVAGPPRRQPERRSLYRTRSAAARSARTRPPVVGQFSTGRHGSCPSGSNSNPAAGCPDGYKALTTNTATVPSGSTASPCGGTTTTRPVFDTSYQYTLSAMLTTATRWPSTPAPRRCSSTSRPNLPTSVFTMAASGSNWTLSPVSNSAQCLDAGAGTNGTGLVLAACNGRSSAGFNISADAQNGNFFVRSPAPAAA